jgi:hypothetical protein
MVDLERISKMKEKGRISVGGSIAGSTAGLFLYANDIDLDAISSVLGAQPTKGIIRGEVVGNRKPAPVVYWNLEAPVDLPFAEKLSYLLGATTNDASTWDSLSRIHDIQLRCAFLNFTELPGFRPHQIVNVHFEIFGTLGVIWG